MLDCREAVAALHHQRQAEPDRHRLRGGEAVSRPGDADHRDQRCREREAAEGLAAPGDRQRLCDVRVIQQHERGLARRGEEDAGEEAENHRLVAVHGAAGPKRQERIGGPDGEAAEKPDEDRHDLAGRLVQAPAGFALAAHLLARHFDAAADGELIGRLARETGEGADERVAEDRKRRHAEGAEEHHRAALHQRQGQRQGEEQQRWRQDAPQIAEARQAQAEDDVRIAPLQVDDDADQQQRRHRQIDARRRCGRQLLRQHEGHDDHLQPGIDGEGAFAPAELPFRAIDRQQRLLSEDEHHRKRHQQQTAIDGRGAEPGGRQDAARAIPEQQRIGGGQDEQTDSERAKHRRHELAAEGFAIAARDELDEPVAEIRLGPEIAGGEERHDGVENDPVLVDFGTPGRQVERDEQQLLANADQLIEQLKEVIHRQPAPRRRLRPTLAGQWFLIGHIGHRAEIRGGKATSQERQSKLDVLSPARSGGAGSTFGWRHHEQAEYARSRLP